MAEANISVAQDQFVCAICLDLLKDPVTVPCGHSYCMSCITSHWNQEDERGVYSCPQCRHAFSPRPALGKNVLFAEMLEKLQRSEPQACVSAGAGDVQCDICRGRRIKAAKSCLTCLESYCQTHFRRHEDFHSGKTHKVIDATGRLQEMICGKHERPLDIYCRTDQRCVCYLCTMDEHKNHDTVTAAAEMTEKQKQLKETQKKFKQSIKEREKELQELKETVKTHKCSAQAAVEDSERIFAELIRSIERSRSEVTQLIRDQEKAVVSQAEGLLQGLEKEIADLKRRGAELEQLSLKDDHIHFLQSFQSLSISAKSTDLHNISITSCRPFDDVGKSVSLLKNKVEEFCKVEIGKISNRVPVSEKKGSHTALEQHLAGPPYNPVHAPYNRVSYYLPLPSYTRQRKQIRIRDPNQGGRDITSEIFSSPSPSQ